MELPERAVLKNLQKEQERERRRLRDRQRRQAMTVEEKEKHLARRRKNYQLRRQRAQTAVLDPQFDQASPMDGGEILMLPSNENQGIISVPLQSNGSLVTFDQRQESLNAGITNSVGLDVPANRLAKLPIRSRLNHVKHLARSVDDTSDKGDNHKIAADLIINGNETSNCMPQKALRLNRVKHLARALSSDLMSPTIQNHESKTAVEQDLPNGDPLMSSDLPKVV